MHSHKQETSGSELLFSHTGRRPFHGTSAGDLVHRILHEAPNMSGLPAGIKHSLIVPVSDTPACSPTNPIRYKKSVLLSLLP